jgi:hypothetical protein
MEPQEHSTPNQPGGPILLNLGPATVHASASLELKVIRGSATASGGDVTIYPPAATARASMSPPTVTVSRGTRLDLSLPHIEWLMGTSGFWFGIGLGYGGKVGGAVGGVAGGVWGEWRWRQRMRRG